MWTCEDGLIAIVSAVLRVGNALDHRHGTTDVEVPPVAFVGLLALTDSIGPLPIGLTDRIGPLPIGLTDPIGRCLRG